MMKKFDVVTKMSSIFSLKFCLINSYFNRLLQHQLSFITVMEQFILVSLFVSYLNGQEVTKTTMSCETETPEPTMRTVDKLKDTWEEFVKVYCEGIVLVVMTRC